MVNLSSVMVTLLNKTAVETEGTYVGDSNYGDVLERSIDLSIGILIAILNLVEIIIILKIKRKKKVYEILLLSLSASDFMLCLSNGFLYAIHAVNAYRYEVLLETVFTLYIFSVLSSVFHILFIGLDRLLAVLRPIRHKVFSTRKKAYLSSGFLWILAILISALLQIISESTEIFNVPNYVRQIQSQSLQKDSKIYGFSGEKIGLTGPQVFTATNKNNYNAGVEYTLSVVLIVADVLIFTLYSLIIYHTTFKTKIASTKTKHKRLTIVCIAIGATFVLLTLPFVIAKLFLGYVPSWANRTLVMNSGMNSIVYFFSGKVKACRRRKNMKSRDITS